MHKALFAAGFAAALVVSTRLAIADRHAIPVQFIGVGEGIEDLSAFTPDEFARGLLDLDPQPTVA